MFRVFCVLTGLMLAPVLLPQAIAQQGNDGEFNLDSIGDTLNRLDEAQELRRDPFAEEEAPAGVEDSGEGEVAAPDNAAPAAEVNEFAADNVIAVLQGLDKVTARIEPVEARVGDITNFGSLQIIARYCRETPPTEAPETWAFLEITEVKEGEAPKSLFSGWMIESSPGLSSLAHPVYDIVVKGCSRVE